MFIPHTDTDRMDMLHSIGVSSLEELFRDVPEKYRFPVLNLPSRIVAMSFCEPRS